MFSKFSNCVLDWINRAEPPHGQQQAGNSINDEFNALASQPNNDAKVDSDQNGDHNGSNSEARGIEEELQDKKKEINEDMNEIPNEKGDENEGGIENEKAIDVVEVAKKKRNRRSRKTQVDKFNGKEEISESAVLEVKGKDDSKAAQIDSKRFNHTGRCDSGEASKFSHGGNTSPMIEFNFMGLPIRLGEKDCPYFMRHGSCKDGENCLFNHPDPTFVADSDSQSGNSNGGSILPAYAAQPYQGLSSLAASGEVPPFVSSMYPSTPGSFSPAGSSQTYVPWMFPPTQGVPSQPEWHAYQAPAYLPERIMQMTSAYTTNSQPLERNVYAHQQHRILADEYLERPGQPECIHFLKTGRCVNGSACRFSHPKNRSAESMSSGHNDWGPPLRPTVQPLVPEAVVLLSCDASFTKKCVGQNSVPNVHKSEPKQPRAFLKKKGANPNARSDKHSTYEEHSSGKEYAKNIQKAHASRIPPAAKVSRSINKSCSADQMGTPSAKGMTVVTNVVPNLETVKKKNDRAREVSALNGKGTSGVTSVVTDLKRNVQKSCSAGEMGTPSGQDKGGVTGVETDLVMKKLENCGAGVTSVGTDLETKKQKLLGSGIAVQSSWICTLCNVVCNGEVAFAEHIGGKKHLSKSRNACEMSTPSEKGAEGATSVVTDVGTEKHKTCNASDMDEPSRKGTAGDTSVVTDLGMVKQKSCSASEMGTSCEKGTAEVMSAVSDLKTKKQNVLEGAAAVKSLGECTMSNVLCIGDIAVAEHLVPAVKKHLSQEQSSITWDTADPALVTNPNSKSNEEKSKITKGDQSARCEVCKISFISFTDSSHEQGTKHKNNLEKSQNLKTHPPTGLAPTSTSSSKDHEDLGTKTQKEQAFFTLTDQNPTSATNPKTKSCETPTKKTNIRPARCAICKVTCTSIEDLNHHKQGKKHKANVGKFQKSSQTDSPLPASTPAPLPSTGSKEFKHLEITKQKVREHGAPADAMRCTLCNVVCNSEKNYNDHLAGQRHATIVKQKQGQEAGNGS